MKLKLYCDKCDKKFTVEVFAPCKGEWITRHCLDCGTPEHRANHSEDAPWYTMPIPPKTLERIEKKILSGEELAARRIVAEAVDDKKVPADGT